MTVATVTTTLRDTTSLPVRLALTTLKAYLGGCPEDELINTPAVAELLRNAQEAELRDRAAGVFVSFKKRGELRGCIGTIAPTANSIIEEIIQNTLSAATRDPRFPPIEVRELPDLSCSVDILGDAESIQSEGDLDVKRYGVIVTSGWRRGLLLPDLEGVDTPAQQVAIALQKAGIAAHES
ncbi:MAG: AmmeMemoRadiSam system protein A, partial [Coriobacteriales bacterium]|nr:AmmeMemoRadiSam system protein A [Coriobacteriales bacterium]